MRPRSRTPRVDPRCTEVFTFGTIDIVVDSQEVREEILGVVQSMYTRAETPDSPFPSSRLVGMEVHEDEEGPGCEAVDAGRLQHRVFKALLGIGLPSVLEGQPTWMHKPDFRMAVIDCEIAEGAGRFEFRLRGYHLYHDGRIRQDFYVPAIGRDAGRISRRDLSGNWAPIWLSELREKERYERQRLIWDGKSIYGPGPDFMREARL